ncbi:MAG: hypothetical protein R8G66_09765 [Cytophagales bacterium]|nr:hypothetical protein [Cytophagales bacterium]
MNDSDQNKKNEWYKDIKVEKNIELADIIKSIVGLIGAVVIYFSIDMASVRIARNSYQLELVKELNVLLPTLDNNYTNELNETKDTLSIRVVIRVVSEMPSYIHTPRISLINKMDSTILDRSLFSVLDSAQSQGIYSPGIKNEITYHVKVDPSIDFEHLFIRAQFLSEIPNSILNRYERLLEKDEWNNLKGSLSIDYGYTERIYNSGENPIWGDFFENPR